MLLKRTPPAWDGAVGASKKKTPLPGLDQWREGIVCNLNVDWTTPFGQYKTTLMIGCVARAIPRPIWAVVRRRRGLSQGYSSTTGLALQRSTSLPVITFLSWVILLGSWDLPGVWNTSLGNTAKCCIPLWLWQFAPYACMWWLKAHVYSTIKLTNFIVCTQC